MNFLSFPDLQRSVNSVYYRSKGVRLYNDFSTKVSRCSKISVANAFDFYGHLSALQEKNSLPDEIIVHEYGIGDGAFAAAFLETMKSMDKKLRESFYPRLHYVLGDISPKLLKQASESKALSVHNGVTEFIELDATRLPFRKSNVSYVRSNEVWDDLPTLLVQKKNGELLEALVALNRGAAEYSPRLLDEKLLNEIPVCWFNNLPESYVFPVPTGALSCLGECLRILDKRQGAYIDVYDYGFNSFDEMLSEPSELWNSFLVREYGTQLTVDVNFLFLSMFAAQRGFNTDFSTIAEYLGHALGEKIFPITLGEGTGAYTGYFTLEELAAHKLALKRAGYSKDFSEGYFSEDDGYRWMRFRSSSRLQKAR